MKHVRTIALQIFEDKKKGSIDKFHTSVFIQNTGEQIPHIILDDHYHLVSDAVITHELSFVSFTR